MKELITFQGRQRRLICGNVSVTRSPYIKEL